MCFLARLVARQALVIVSRRILYQRLMWIVAGNASKTSIALLPTSAALEPVRRETNGSDVTVLSHHIPPCAVTCPAKIDRLTRGEV